MADLGQWMPMRVIGMLLGIPEEHQTAIRERSDAKLRTEPGQPMEGERGDPARPGAVRGSALHWPTQNPTIS